MVEVKSPLVMIETYHKPALFTDHFLEKNLWAGTESGSNLVDRSGQAAVLTIAAGHSSQGLGRTLFCDTSVKRFCIVRVLAFSGSAWEVIIHRNDNQQFVTAYHGIGTGQVVVNLASAYSGNIQGIILKVLGSPGQSVSFDYCAVAEGYVNVPWGDVVGDVSIVQSDLSKGVYGAKVTVANFEGDSYLSSISADDAILIWVARESQYLGNPDYKLFGGRIMDPSVEYKAFNVAYLHLDCHGHGYELNCPPANVSKSYAAANGQLIVDYALGICNYLHSHPLASNWFDNSGATGSTDDRILSVHSVDYDGTKPLDPLLDIMENASNGNNIGFSVHETPEGCLIGHLRGSQDFVCPITPVLMDGVLHSDRYPLVNRQKVYGASNRYAPLSKDFGCETSADLALWTLDYGAGMAMMAANQGFLISPIVGSKILQANGGGNTSTSGKTQIHIDVSAWTFGAFKGSFKTGNFGWGYSISWPDTMDVFQIQLWAPDAANCFFANLRHNSNGLALQQENIAFGSSAEYDSTKDSSSTNKWQKHGNPSWLTVTTLCVLAKSNNVHMAPELFFDGLYFSDGAFQGVADDLVSQSVYRVIEGEPIVDASLLSDDECQVRAAAVIASSKDPHVSVEPVTVDGDQRYVPGDRFTIFGVYCIPIIITHTVSKCSWTAKLEFAEV